ncbi:NHL repeat-containing protein [Chitinimonas naiadis]
MKIKKTKYEAGHFRLALAGGLAALLLAACGGGGGGSGDGGAVQPPAALTVAASSLDAFSGLGGAITLSASGQGSSDVVWTLSGPGSLSAASGASVQYLPPATILAEAAATVTAASKGATVATSIALHSYGPIAPLAGRPGGTGVIDGPLAEARLFSPTGVTVDAAGNVYFSEDVRNTLRRVGTDGRVTTVAGQDGESGYADGPAAQARFKSPAGLYTDSTGTIFVADTYNNAVRAIAADGKVTTVAGVPGESTPVDGARSVARFAQPTQITSDGAQGLYVLDGAIRRIRADGTVSTVVAQEPANVSVPKPVSIAVHAGLLYGYYSDEVIRVMQPDGKVVNRLKLPSPAELLSPYAGYDSAKSWGTLGRASGMTVDEGGNVFVSMANVVIPVIYIQPFSYVLRVGVDGKTSIFAGTPFFRGTLDGPGAVARFDGPNGLTFDAKGNLLVADRTNGIVRKIAADATVTTLAGVPSLDAVLDGNGRQASFYRLNSLTSDSAGNVYGLDYEPLSSRYLVRKISLEGQAVVTSGYQFGYVGLSRDAQGRFYGVDNYQNVLRKLDTNGVVSTLAGVEDSSWYGGSIDGAGAAARFARPTATATDASGNIYVADTNAVRKVTPVGVVSTLAGKSLTAGTADGQGDVARFTRLIAISVDANGNVYVLDQAAPPEADKLQPVAIRKITPSGSVSTLYRLPVPVPPYRYPMRDIHSLAVDDAGNVYVAAGVISDFPSSEPGLIWSRSLIYKLSSAGTLSVVAGDESGKQIGTRFGPLPGSLDVPKAISYLGKRRFAVSTGDAVLLLTLP